MKLRTLGKWVTLVASLMLLAGTLLAQETTGGLVGTVKDPTGAVVPGAKVVATAPSLTGNKEFTTDSAGNYRFSNLPPDTYTITVTAKGFATVKREGVTIEVGHLPTLDIPMQIGGTDTVVEVSGQAPLIDTTTNTTQTNITEDVVNDVPHGRSFQSVIQFAPSARNEPLAGSNPYNGGTGTGGTSPGNGSNGSDHGFSVAGGADSENSYLVEGQQTADLAGGFSHTNVPFDFIQEVQVKSSGIEAEHGGALGGVVNVVMKKGTNQYHGSVFAQFENDSLDGSPVAFARYDPNGNPIPTGGAVNTVLDVPYQQVQPIRPHTSDVFPGFTLGGPILKDKIFGFIGFNPEWNDQERKINYGPSFGGIQPFSQNTQTYYTTARIDASVTQKLRVYASWLYQYQRQTGESLPHYDSTTSLFNISTGCFGAAGNCNGTGGVPTFAYAHDLGYSAPNSTTNIGADFTITPHIVSTTRFGYYFENYHDFGYPTTGQLTIWNDAGSGGMDAFGNPLPASLQQSAGYFNAAQNQNDTQRNANKAIQFDQDVAWFKSGWKGSHNFKFGYQLNRLSNDLSQHWNEPATLFNVGNLNTNPSAAYSPTSPNGAAACGLTGGAPSPGLFVSTNGCAGQYGFVTIEDFGSLGKATSFNHGLFAQDAWTIGRGITINAGIRFDKEYLPGEGGGTGSSNKPINFSWTDKVAPRIGAAWDVFQNGKMKVFGSYGKFFDIMKLNLAISSFGGQYWQNCVYGLNTSNLASIDPAFNASGRFCGGPGTDSTTQANFGSGGTPAGLTFIENTNFRAFPTTCSTCSATQEGVAPGLKPYEQHESVFGVDYQLQKNLAFEARWDRRRLDHVIEDSALYNPSIGETFVIGNPGQGVEKTFNGFWNFLYGCSASNPTACANSLLNGVPQVCDPTTGQCPPTNLIPGARSYDGVELRLTKATSNHWFGMFSYTYSKLRGNYTGLTTTDIADGGGGRNAPNNSRSFDEPYFQWNANGGSSSGLLPTDRPNAFKGYAYYELGWMKKFTSDFGIFQYAYSGSPLTTYADVGFSSPGAWPVDIVDRGKWVDVTQDPTTGAITLGAPRTNRTPWYTQTDFNFSQNYKIAEEKVLNFSATFANLWNQRAVTSEGQQLDSNILQSFMSPNNTFVASQGFYANAERPYNVQSLLNQPNLFGEGNVVYSQYGKPYLYQTARTIRLGVKFTF